MKLKEYLETRKISKNIFKVIVLTVFVLSLNSLSYAYFTSTIEGEGKEIVLSTSDISIKFEDNEAIKKTGLTPGERIIKKFSVTFEERNPSEIMGGSWERVSEGKTLVGVDEDDSSFNVSSKTGGSKSTTLTVSNLPKHTHSIPALSGKTSTNSNHSHWGDRTVYAIPTFTQKIGYVSGSYGWMIASSGVVLEEAGDHSHIVTTNTSTTGSSGSGSSFSNLQPYITVYMWKRIS